MQRKMSTMSLSTLLWMTKLLGKVFEWNWSFYTLIWLFSKHEFQREKSSLITPFLWEATYTSHHSNTSSQGWPTLIHLTVSIIKDNPSPPRGNVKKVLVFGSDNCQEQYKYKYTFFQMRKLATDFGIKSFGFMVNLACWSHPIFWAQASI